MAFKLCFSPPRGTGAGLLVALGKDHMGARGGSEGQLCQAATLQTLRPKAAVSHISNKGPMCVMGGSFQETDRFLSCTL